MLLCLLLILRSLDWSHLTNLDGNASACSSSKFYQYIAVLSHKVRDID